MRFSSAGAMIAVQLAVTLLFLPTVALAQSEPSSTLRAEREAAEARDEARLIELLENPEALETALEEARVAHEQAEARHTELQEEAQALSERQNELEARQQEQGEEFEAILASLARHSGELRDGLANSWLTLEEEALPPRLDDAGVLEVTHLEDFADRLVALTADTARVTSFEAPVASASGEITPQPVVRLGDFAAFSEGHLLRRGVGEGALSVVERTPREVATHLVAFQAGTSPVLALDPTQGEVISALGRSEERRVGKECRSRWWPDQ